MSDIKEQTGPGSDETFAWTCESGDVIQLPSLAQLDPDMDVMDQVADAMQSPNPIVRLAANRTFLIASLPDDSATDLRKVRRMKEFSALLEAWSKWSGVEPGELSAS